jgi:hypothetical protein
MLKASRCTTCGKTINMKASNWIKLDSDLYHYTCVFSKAAYRKALAADKKK